MPLRSNQAMTRYTQRCNLLQEQLKIYLKSDVSWSIWLYKDIGYQGMVYVDPESPWMRLIASFLAKKSVGVDFWDRDNKDVQHIYKPLLDHIEEVVPQRFHIRRYPSPLWTVSRHAERVLREMLLSKYLTFEMAEYFEGKSSRSWTRWQRASNLRSACREQA